MGRRTWRGSYSAPCSPAFRSASSPAAETHVVQLSWIGTSRPSCKREDVAPALGWIAAVSRAGCRLSAEVRPWGPEHRGAGPAVGLGSLIGGVGTRWEPAQLLCRYNAKQYNEAGSFSSPESSPLIWKKGHRYHLTVVAKIRVLHREGTSGPCRAAFSPRAAAREREEKQRS